MYKNGKSKKADVVEFERHLEDNLFDLHCKLQSGDYIHDGYTYFTISDPKKRNIHKSTVKDRIVHQLLYDYLYQIYEPIFIRLSFSSRKDKGANRAVTALSNITKYFRKTKKPCLAMKCDIKKYFDNIDQKVLLEILKEKVQDKSIINLLSIVIGSFNRESCKGVPLGNITSQIFANIYLNELDKFVSAGLGVKHYIRYNDDFIILGEDESKLYKDTEKIKQFLWDSLRLELPYKKIFFRKLGWGIDFCGYIVLPNAVLLRNKTKGRMYEKINLILTKARLGKISEQELQTCLNSYFGVLSHCNSFNLRMKIKNVCANKFD